MDYGHLVGHNAGESDPERAAERVALEAEHFDLTSDLVRLEHLLADPGEAKRHAAHQRDHDTVSARRAEVLAQHERLADDS